MRFVLLRSIPALAASLLLPGCVMISGFEHGDRSDRYQTDFHYSFNLAPNGRINVESYNGSIEIAGWDENKVEISGTKFASTEQLRDAIRIEIHDSPDAVEIRTIQPTGHFGGFGPGNFGNMGTRYVIHVPRMAQLDHITTSNASIHVHDVATAAHLKSSNGSVRVENVAGDVDARTSNSSIDLDSVRGNAAMKTTNGRIRAESIGGACEAETTNNGIHIRLDTASPAPMRLVTSNGPIELSLDKAPKNDIRAETRNSSITLRLPATASARIAANTTNSSVSSDFEVRGDPSEDHKKNHLDGTIGNGGPRIDLSSSNGHIRIVKGIGE